MVLGYYNREWMYELPHEAPNKLRLKILRNYEFPTKTLKCLQLKLSVQFSRINGDFDSCVRNTAWKVSKCGGFSGPYFPAFGPYLPVFSPNTGKYIPEKLPYLDTFHAVKISKNRISHRRLFCSTLRICLQDRR